MAPGSTPFFKPRMAKWSLPSISSNFAEIFARASVSSGENMVPRAARCDVRLELALGGFAQAREQRLDDGRRRRGDEVREAVGGDPAKAPVEGRDLLEDARDEDLVAGLRLRVGGQALRLQDLE